MAKTENQIRNSGSQRDTEVINSARYDEQNPRLAKARKNKKRKLYPPGFGKTERFIMGKAR